MSCCGQSRLSATGIEPVPRKVRIAYLGNNSFRVHGTFTGLVYAFSPQRRVQLVDASDSRVLLRTRFFRHA